MIEDPAAGFQFAERKQRRKKYGTHFGSAYRVSMQGIYSLKELYFHALGQVDKKESADIGECLEKDLTELFTGIWKDRLTIKSQVLK